MSEPVAAAAAAAAAEPPGPTLPPELDMVSESFDPEQALLRRPAEVVVPYPAVKPVDNIARWLSITQAQARQKQKELLAQEQAAAAAAQAAAEGLVQVAVDETAHPGHESNRKRFGLLSVEEVAARRRERELQRLTQGKSVLHRMQAIDNEGPVAVLHRLLHAKAYIRVDVRQGQKVYARCCGYLAAFDKHHNMVLRDVREETTQTQKLTRREINSNYPTATRRQRRKAKATVKHRVTLVRCLKQLFIKGENVVLVCRTDEPEAKVDRSTADPVQTIRRQRQPNAATKAAAAEASKS